MTTRNIGTTLVVTLDLAADANAGEDCGDRPSACDLGRHLDLILETRVAGTN